jgi:hypothetical protein
MDDPIQIPPDSWGASVITVAERMEKYFTRLARGADALAAMAPSRPGAEDAPRAWAALAQRCAVLAFDARATHEHVRALCVGWHSGLTARELVPWEAVEAYEGVFVKSEDAEDVQLVYGMLRHWWALERERAPLGSPA